MALHRPIADLRCWSAALVVVLAACGGSGSDPPGASASDPVTPAGAMQPGEVPGQLLLAEPRNVDNTPRIAMAWSSEGAFTGRLVAQIEFGFGFAPGPLFTLQHNGAPGIYETGDETGAVNFEMRYADGFFVLTAQRDNNMAQFSLPFGVDLYPPDVPRVPPIAPPCPAAEGELCSNSLEFIAMFDWPTRAADPATRLIPRADPARLTYTVLTQPSAEREFHETLAGVSGQSQTMARGPARMWDFPTARVKVRGCNGAGECVDSAERSLQAALVRGVVAFDFRSLAPSGSAALNAIGDRLVLTSTQGNLPRDVVSVLQRDPEQDRWFYRASIEGASAGFGRRVTISADGNALAVEASPCAVTTIVCNTSAVHVYAASDPFGHTWVEQARFDGVRAPQLSEDGHRLLAVGVGARARSVAVFERSDSTWTERPFPLLDYTPLELALAAHGRTAAVARQGTQADPCGCRAVVVYDRNDAGVWSAVAVLRSNKRLDTVGSANDDGFGHAGATTRSLALNGDGTVVAVGASLDSSDANDAVGDPDNHSAPNSGAIYVFQRQADNTFAMQAFVKAKGAASFDRFGHSVALNRSGVVLSGGARGLAADAPGVNRNHAPDPALPAATPAPNGALTGAGAYTFERTGNAWVHKAKIVAPNADSAHFSSLHGMAVSGDGDTLVLGTGAPDAAGGVARRFFVY